MARVESRVGRARCWSVEDEMVDGPSAVPGAMLRQPVGNTRRAVKDEMEDGPSAVPGAMLRQPVGNTRRAVKDEMVDGPSAVPGAMLRHGSGIQDEPVGEDCQPRAGAAEPPSDRLDEALFRNLETDLLSSGHPPCPDDVWEVVRRSDSSATARPRRYAYRDSTPVRLSDRLARAVNVRSWAVWWVTWWPVLVLDHPRSVEIRSFLGLVQLGR
ncbi:hypothetical protein PZA11_007869 [Diplocarpon coronariae]|uniref:Uncharacterized protein n=1 Tax=Diplocarpon coronariae TaxID=2795749 RepID=A0A218ZDV3_9HELO|nr:hypothetical protein B2J93_6248 [Marssonina coronariae]